MIGASFSHKNAGFMLLQVEPGALAADPPDGGLRGATPASDPGGPEERGERGAGRGGGGQEAWETTERTN